MLLCFRRLSGSHKKVPRFIKICKLFITLYNLTLPVLPYTAKVYTKISCSFSLFESVFRLLWGLIKKNGASATDDLYLIEFCFSLKRMWSVSRKTLPLVSGWLTVEIFSSSKALHGPLTVAGAVCCAVGRCCLRRVSLSIFLAKVSGQGYMWDIWEGLYSSCLCTKTYRLSIWNV